MVLGLLDDTVLGVPYPTFDTVGLQNGLGLTDATALGVPYPPLWLVRSSEELQALPEVGTMSFYEANYARMSQAMLGG